VSSCGEGGPAGPEGPKRGQCEGLPLLYIEKEKERDESKVGSLRVGVTVKEEIKTCPVQTKRGKKTLQIGKNREGNRLL